MPHDQIPTDVDAAIDESLGEQAPKKGRRSRRKREPSYKVVGSSKIPVSKSTGKVWKSRVAQAEKQTEHVRRAWSEAIRYYENDQLDHRQGRENGSGNVIGNTKLNNNITETENVVFANVTTMVPALYARNPEAEFTSNVEANRKIATTLERLVNVIGGRKAVPGVNLKPKVKRCVVTTLLTNRSWMKIGWTPKTESSEQALEDLATLSKDLEKAKDGKRIIEIEGQIAALEETVSILQPAGPFCKVKSPFDILIDTNAKEIDLTDANWLIEADMLPTEFLLAMYANKGKGTEYKSIYKPTHVMKASLSAEDGEQDAAHFSIFNDSKDETAKSFGFNDQESFDKAKLTKVYFVWDKVTRRVLLFNSADWTWPIWVWDDPLQLDTFFPYYPLTFFESPSGPLTKGEVSYYLDQQDSINEIADEQRRARKWARRNIFYNSNTLSQEDAAAVLNGDDGTARGLNVPPETDLTKVISSIPPPSIQFEQMFNKAPLYEAIEKISSVSAVMQGAQFKTNTNKDAVNANVGASNMRVDEKTDAIEDWIGQIYWGIAQLCIMKMDKQTVVDLIGEEESAEWKTMQANEIRSMSHRVVGGSTQKPTSAAKKEEALEFGQVLGQFVNAAPGPVLKMMFQVMEKAFDEVTMREEDFEELQAAIDQQSGGGDQSSQGQQASGPDVSSASPEQLKKILAQLPPEAKKIVTDAIASGVPAEQALKSAIEQLQQQPQAGGSPPVAN